LSGLVGLDIVALIILMTLDSGDNASTETESMDESMLDASDNNPAHAG
jgi:hypothetical protein